MENFINKIKAIIPVHTFSRAARLFLVATIIDGIIYSGFNLFFNLFILARGLGSTYMGAINSIPNLAALLFGIPLGRLSDRLGRRKSMMIGILVGTIGWALQVSVHDPTLMLVMGFVSGLGNTLYFVSQAPFMMKASTEENRALLFSLNFGLITLAGAVGSLFAGQLPELFGGLFNVAADSSTSYQAVLICCTILGSLSLIPIFLIQELPRDHAAETAPKSKIMEVFRRPVILKLFLPQLLIGFGAAILIPYINVYFQGEYGYNSQSLGMLFSISALLTGLGSILGPRLAVRIGSKVDTVVLTQGGSLLFLVLMGFSPWGWLAAASFLIRGTLMNMASPLYSAFAMEKTPEDDQGVVSSLMNISWTVGWVVGPLISGWVQGSIGFSPLFIATTILYFSSSLLVWRFFHGSDRKPKDKLEFSPV